MTIQNGEIIYNKIEQGLSYIPGDLVVLKHVRLSFGITISSGKFIINQESPGPMKIQEKEVTARKTGSLTGGPMSYKRNGFWGGAKKKFVKLRWKLEVVSMVLFSSGFMASVMHIRLSSLLKYC